MRPRLTIRRLLFAALPLAAVIFRASAADSKILWQIGVADHNDAEFALAPKGYLDFKNDGFFVVGRSDVARDWPYVHPGPDDGWAGAKQHTFQVFFGLKAAPRGGDFRLTINFLDAHARNPPRFRAMVNGHVFEKELPAGAGDPTIFGNPTNGNAFTWSISLPPADLRAGINNLELTSIAGSWALYDNLQLEVPAGIESAEVAPSTRIQNVEVPPLWLKDGTNAVQPVRVTIVRVGPELETSFQLDALKVGSLTISNGIQAFDFTVPANGIPRAAALTLLAKSNRLDSANITLTPPAVREMWLLPHSHVDIGYTHRQSEVVELQTANLEKAMDLASISAGNAPGMRFKWSPEAAWTLDHFLQAATPMKRARFIAAVQAGQVEVDAGYANTLTGLCRPEELAQYLAFGASLAGITARPVTSAMMCDVPGYTWGIVPMMAQAGVKYFAMGPNAGDRVGTIHLRDDQPFYWKAPDGREKVLCWMADNYHHFGNVEAEVMGHLAKLNQKDFRYDMAFMYWVGRWPGGGVDNAPPDETLVEKVIAWNDKYAAPRVIIGTVGEFMGEFERRHGSRVPAFGGDLTPYWEDGAGSTSRETAMNRATDERLSQAEALFAMRDPRARAGDRFEEAWKNALLYSEHTWGAYCSISQPDSPFTRDQWEVKREFAVKADAESRELLAAALPKRIGPVVAIDVFNTTSWPRTDLATVPAAQAPLTVVSVLGEDGQAVPSQRLASGALVFLARDVPAFGAKRFRLGGRAVPAAGGAQADKSVLATETLRVELDPVTGAIKSLRRNSPNHEFVDQSAPVGLNDFRYVLGTNAASARPNDPVKITIVDNGPLVATLRIDSDAPGCRRLTRFVTLVDGLDRVELTDEVDRLVVREKDAIHFGFGFNIPGGTVRMETPWAVVRPNVDQLPGSCRNWFPVQRWVDVSGNDRGITLAPVDAPLIEIGGITANLLGSVPFDQWMTNAPNSATLYSWAQNNHWHTNYKIDQPGLTTFRYILRPHEGGYSAAAAERFGQETTRPLIVAPADGTIANSLFTVESPDVVVETLKVSDDGHALVLRLLNTAADSRSAGLAWGRAHPRAVWLSDLAEHPLVRADESLEIPGRGVVTVRADLP